MNILYLIIFLLMGKDTIDHKYFQNIRHKNKANYPVRSENTPPYNYGRMTGCFHKMPKWDDCVWHFTFLILEYDIIWSYNNKRNCQNIEFSKLSYIADNTVTTINLIYYKGKSIVHINNIWLTLCNAMIWQCYSRFWQLRRRYVV